MKRTASNGSKLIGLPNPKCSWEVLKWSACYILTCYSHTVLSDRHLPSSTVNYIDMSQCKLR